MTTRTSRVMGAVLGTAAIAVSLPLAVTAYAQPAPTPTPTEAPEQPIPNLEGDCDPFRAANPNWKTYATQPVGQVLSQIPDVSTFSSAVSGGLNPAVNIVPVLENGPYVVFAPTNEAFAKLPPEQLESYRTDASALTDLDYYHVFLGLLGPGDVKGQRPTQQGAEIKVEGTNGDITVNDTAKVICGGIAAENARIYIIDTVLNPASPPEALTPTPQSSTTTTTTPTLPAADAPIG